MKYITLVGLVVVLLLAAGLYAWQANAPTAPSSVVTPLVTPAISPLPVTPGINQTIQQVPSSMPDEAQALGDAATITITDTGFDPATLTVVAGTTITFINNGQALHWPASSVHPTHEELPGFDVERGLATGETYDYTFTAPGTWSFHDHLQPALQGQIIVQ